MTDNKFEEKITLEEQQAVQNAKTQVTIAKLQAEKFVAVAQNAELEIKNLILSIYNKYSLRVGVDNILETGKIIRKEDLDSTIELTENETVEGE